MFPIHANPETRSNRTHAPLALLALLVGVLAALPGCPDKGGPGGGPGGDDPFPGRPVGWVDMAEAQIGGGFMNVASAAYWIESETGEVCGMEVQEFADGECTITSIEAPTCDTACGTEEICLWTPDCGGGECVPTAALPGPPIPGDITITGGSRYPTVTGTFDEETSAYVFDVPTGDWWDDGDTLTVSAPGDVVPGFSVQMTAPAPPEVLTDTAAWTPETFSGDADVAVDWVAGDGMLGTTIVVITDESMLLCVTGDDGNFDIPAAGIAALGSSPPVWIVSIDYTEIAVANEGQPGETLISTGTSGGSAFIINP